MRPPYGVSELALAAQLTPGYVSRLLDALDREALVERSRRGAVDSVDLPGLLRRWSESYDVLEDESLSSFLEPNGTTEALERLAAPASTDGRRLITDRSRQCVLGALAAPALLWPTATSRPRSRLSWVLAPGRRGRQRRPAHPV